MDSKELTRILRQHNSAALEDFVAAIRAAQAEAVNEALDRLRSQVGGINPPAGHAEAEMETCANQAIQHAREIDRLMSEIEGLHGEHAAAAETILDIAQRHAEELTNLLAKIAKDLQPF